MALKLMLSMDRSSSDAVLSYFKKKLKLTKIICKKLIDGLGALHPYLDNLVLMCHVHFSTAFDTHIRWVMLYLSAWELTESSHTGIHGFCAGIESIAVMLMSKLMQEKACDIPILNLLWWQSSARWTIAMHTKQHVDFTSITIQRVEAVLPV